MTGELRPGVDREDAARAMGQLFSAPLDTLRQLFDGVSHPVDQVFSEGDAIAMCGRLERLGVVSRVERIPARPLDLRPRPTAAAGTADYGMQAGLMRCPACGHEQIVAETCGACGVNFEAFNRQRRRIKEGAIPRGPLVQPSPAANPRPASPPKDRGKPCLEDLEDDVPEEEVELTLFVGPKAAHYREVFERFGSPDRPRWVMSWNWGAALSPFLWMLYRKMWSWVPVVALTEVLAPLVILVLDARGVLSPGMDAAAYMLIVVNRLFWPAAADFLYFRHVRVSINRLHRMSLARAHELEIIVAGGVSRTAVFLGIAFALVMGLSFWNIVDALHIGRLDPLAAQVDPPPVRHPEFPTMVAGGARQLSPLCDGHTPLGAETVPRSGFDRCGVGTI